MKARTSQPNFNARKPLPFNDLGPSHTSPCFDCPVTVSVIVIADRGNAKFVGCADSPAKTPVFILGIAAPPNSGRPRRVIRSLVDLFDVVGLGLDLADHTLGGDRSAVLACYGKSRSTDRS